MFDLAFTSSDRCPCKLATIGKPTLKQKYTPCYIYARVSRPPSHSLRASSTRLDSFHRAPVAAATLIGAQEKASVGVARPGRVLRSVAAVVDRRQR